MGHQIVGGGESPAGRRVQGIPPEYQVRPREDRALPEEQGPGRFAGKAQTGLQVQRQAGRHREGVHVVGGRRQRPQPPDEERLQDDGDGAGGVPERLEGERRQPRHDRALEGVHEAAGAFRQHCQG